MKGYRERYRPVPLFTEGYRPAQGYRHVQGGVQGYKPGQGYRPVLAGGGGGGVYRTVQWVQACTGVKACTCREGYRGTSLDRGTGLHVLVWVGLGVQDYTRVQACTGVQACTRVMACTGRGSGLYHCTGL